MAKRFPILLAAVFAVLAACTSTPRSELPALSAGSHDDPEARRNWYWSQRAFPAGTIPVETHLAEVRRELQRTKALATHEQVWENLGPKPLLRVPLGNTTAHDASGRALAVALHPADPKTILIGTAMGGIWKSVDGGQTFYSTGPEQQLPTLAVGVLKYSPNDPNVLYAGTGEAHGSTSMYGSGLLRSRDGGESWEQLPIRGNGWSFEYTAITGLHFDVNDASTLYATTATVTASVFRAPPNLPQTGLFKSTDGGMSWTLLRAAVRRPGPSGSVGFLDFEYGGAVAPDVFYLSEYHGGILRSRNRGATFDYVTPQTANGFGTFPQPIAEMPYYESTRRYYRRLKRFTNPANIADFRRVEIGMAASNPEVLIAGFESSNRLDFDEDGVYDAERDRTQNMSLLFKSEDGGDTWRWLGDIFDGVPDYCSRQCQYDNVVTINPENENDILIGGSANYNAYTPDPPANPRTVTNLPWRGMVYRSLDGGRSWVDTTPHCNRIEPQSPPGTLYWVYACMSEDSTKVIHPDIHAIVFGKDGTLYVANDGGLYRTTLPQVPPPTPATRRRSVGKVIPGANLEYRWETLNNGLATLQFYRIASHPTDPNILLGGMQDNSSGYWNGQVWEGWGGGDGTIAEFDPVDPRIMYMGTQFAVHRHSNGGAKQYGKWKTIFTGSRVAAGETIAFVPVFAIDKVDPQIVYGATDKALYRSMDRGNNISRVNITTTIEGTPTSISVSPVDNNRVWVSTSQGKVYRYDFTSEFTAVVTNVSVGLPSRHISQVRAGLDGAGVVYAVFSGYDANTPGTPGKVFLSTDGGSTWKNISTNLPDVPASAVELDPFDVNRLWIAQDTAVYTTRDRGASWSSERRNMPIVGILDIEYNPKTKYLIAATHGRGVWRMPVE